MASTVVLQRPLPIRVAAAFTLTLIIAWAALSGGSEGFGTFAYPAIIGLQTAREFLWRLEVSKQGIREKQGVGPTRELTWKQIEQAVMPDAVWWRINPILKVAENPNIQMTAGDGVMEVLDLVRARRREIVGNPSSITMRRSLLPWLILMVLASLLLGGAIATNVT